MSSFLALAGKKWNEFRGRRGGNVAMLTAIASFVLFGLVGISVDLSRTLSAKAQLQNALDSAALAISAKPDLSEADKVRIAQAYLDSNFRNNRSNARVSGVTVTPGDGTLKLSANLSVPTTLARLFNGEFTTSAESTAIWGQSKIWVSMALDNTGSMNETDSRGVTKLTALKQATNQLLDILQGVARNPDDVQVALIPFSKTVNVGTSKVGQSWIDWTDWEAPPANWATTYNGAALSTFGTQGSNRVCPWRTSGSNSVGFNCMTATANGSSVLGGSTTLPSNRLCPSVDNGSRNSGRSGRYYNGCFYGTNNNPNCTNNCTYTWTWQANPRSTWTGCIMDRTQPYDIDRTSPTNTATRFPAENSTACVPSVMDDSLNHNWTQLRAKTNAMVAGGNTNQTIGLQWAMMAHTQGAPFNTPALPRFTNRYIILLSDGLNTQNRWSSSQSAIDDRMSRACTNAKAAGMVIYSIYVNTGGSGSSSVMRNCATDPTKFYQLTTSGAIIDAFRAIGIQISQLRIATPEQAAAMNGN